MCKYPVTHNTLLGINVLKKRLMSNQTEISCQTNPRKNSYAKVRMQVTNDIFWCCDICKLFITRYILILKTVMRKDLTQLQKCMTRSKYLFIERKRSLLKDENELITWIYFLDFLNWKTKQQQKLGVLKSFFNPPTFSTFTGKPKTKLNFFFAKFCRFCTRNEIIEALIPEKDFA